MARTETSTLGTPAGIRLPEPGTYPLDPSHTAVNFTARHLMVTKVRGRFPVRSGTLVVAEDPARSSVEVEIDVAALHTGDDGRDTHLRSADFFDVERFPTATFRSNGVVDDGRGEYLVTGDLTLRDVTRPVTLRVEYLGVEQDPWGSSRIGFSASTEVNRKDWGLGWNVALETGGVLVGDKVTLSIDAQAISG